MYMTTTPNRRALWVKREDSPTLPDSVLRGRAGVDPAAEEVEVEIKAVGKWGNVSIPAGARDESGSVLPPLNVGHPELPPEGKVFLLEVG
jgi:hypothetical protein